MTTRDIFLEAHGATGQLVLNRPQRKNALTEAMWAELPALLASAAADDAIKVLIVRGTGGAFSSGADIGEFEAIYASPERADANSRAIAEALDALADFPKPTLAQIDGVCIGGGCGLALACDVRFAAEGSRFAITPAKLGLAYPLNDTRRLVDVVGIAHARDILLSARTLDGPEALHIGLINRLLPASELEREAQTYAAGIHALSPNSARLTKAMIAMISTGTRSETERSRDMFRGAFQSADFQTGYQAFLAKRKPDFSGGDDR